MASEREVRVKDNTEIKSLFVCLFGVKIDPANDKEVEVTLERFVEGVPISRYSVFEGLRERRLEVSHE